MTEMPAYKELKRRTRQLESEVLEYVRKEKEFNKEQKFVEYGHMKRTISLMKINVDFIPPAIQYPEITCARIMFDRYEFKTKSFKDTKWKLSHEIKVNNERIGTLEVCYLIEKQEFEEESLLEETKN